MIEIINLDKLYQQSNNNNKELVNFLHKIQKKII